MEAITLEYNVRNRKASRAVEINRSLGLTRKKSGLEEALEDVAAGRLTTIHIPKNKTGK